MSEIAEVTETIVRNGVQIIPYRMTWDEFLAFGNEDTWAEWVDGEVIIMFSASTRHQEIVLFLAQVLGIYVRSRNLGDVFIAPFAMKLEAERRGREPDLLFVSQERKYLI